MDKLLKLSQEHGEVFESLAFFKKAMPVANAVTTPGLVKKFHKLFEEYVLAHFTYEENKIFIPVLKSGLIEAQQIVRELQGEHIQILGALDMFRHLARESGTPDTTRLKKIKEEARYIIRLVVAHARKEDSRFFPLVKKLKIKL